MLHRKLVAIGHATNSFMTLTGTFLFFQENSFILVIFPHKSVNSINNMKKMLVKCRVLPFPDRLVILYRTSIRTYVKQFTKKNSLLKELTFQVCMKVCHLYLLNLVQVELNLLFG